MFAGQDADSMAADKHLLVHNQCCDLCASMQCTTRSVLCSAVQCHCRFSSASQPCHGSCGVGLVTCALQHKQHCASETTAEVDSMVQRLCKALSVQVYATCRDNRGPCHECAAFANVATAPTCLAALHDTPQHDTHCN